MRAVHHMKAGPGKISKENWKIWSLYNEYIPPCVRKISKENWKLTSSSTNLTRDMFMRRFQKKIESRRLFNRLNNQGYPKKISKENWKDHRLDVTSMARDLAVIWRFQKKIERVEAQ